MYLAGFIAQTLGLSSSVVKQRLGLLTLPTILGQGVKMGKVARGVAAKIANLPRAQQDQLTTKYLEKGKLTAHDVQDVRRVKQEAVLAELPENLFASIASDPEVRAKVVLKDFMDEGVSADPGKSGGCCRRALPSDLDGAFGRVIWAVVAT